MTLPVHQLIDRIANVAPDGGCGQIVVVGVEAFRPMLYASIHPQVPHDITIGSI